MPALGLDDGGARGTTGLVELNLTEAGEPRDRRGALRLTRPLPTDAEDRHDPGENEPLSSTEANGGPRSSGQVHARAWSNRCAAAPHLIGSEDRLRGVGVCPMVRDGCLDLPHEDARRRG